MKTTRYSLCLVAAAAAIAGPATADAQTPLGTAFTYQGQLKQAGNPVTELCQFEFSLWDGPTGAGSQVGATQYLLDVEVQDGLFTVLLNAGGEFGPSAFDGQARWLEITVTVPPDDPVTLSPRQELTPAPYAFYAEAAPWSGLAGVPDGFADGIDDDTTYDFGDGLLWDGVILSLDPDYMLPQACADGQVPKWNSATDLWECADDQTGGGSAWLLTGNAGTVPGVDFLGTTDNVSLELRVNDAGALRIEPAPYSPNLIGGYNGNYVTAAVGAGTIGGGGSSGWANRVTDWAGTVSGGLNNQAGDAAGTTDDMKYATVGGGLSNTASSIYSTVGGGWSNTASSFAATVGGGNSNTASGNYAVVAGGHENTASGVRSMIPGGMYNTAGGSYSFAAGRRAKANHDGAFVWADSTDADFASTGADQLLIRANGGVGIGTNGPNSPLHVVGAHVDGDGSTGVVTVINTAADGWYTPGIYSEHNVTDGVGIGVRGVGGYIGVHGRVDPTGSGDYYGAAGVAVGGEGTNYGVYGYASGDGVSYAGYFDGDLHATGEITKAYTDGTRDRAIPIAYGFIDYDGTVSSGTPNFTCTYNSTAGRYEITIVGEDYFWEEYVTTVTPASWAPRFVATGSVSGKLLVYILDLAGNDVQGYFQFVTYKPGALGIVRLGGQRAVPTTDNPYITDQDVADRGNDRSTPDRPVVDLEQAAEVHPQKLERIMLRPPERDED